jgi:hypothetical protein
VRFNAKQLTAVAVLFAGTALAASVGAQHTGHTMPMPSPPASATPPAPITMEELHRGGGVPRGWKFTLPPGNASAGRALFGKLECNKCHEVRPDYPRGERAAGDVGPDLTGMGGHHPAEYFAQSIVDPNAVIVAGPGFVGPDGRSIMPDYRDTLTFTELVDLVAYLKSAGGGEHEHHAASPARELTAGPYRVRVEYRDAGTEHQHPHGAHGAHGTGGHLMVYLADAVTGEPVPYVPVSVVVTASQAPPRTLQLSPMLGGSGFHYGADVTLPAATTKLTLRLGAVALKTMGTEAARYGKPVTVSVDWK